MSDAEFAAFVKQNFPAHRQALRRPAGDARSWIP